MNKQTEDIKFFTDNLGVAKYPVKDVSGSLLSNVFALVGLFSQTELELCANYLKGKVMAFEKSIDGQFVMLNHNYKQQYSNHQVDYQGVMARGVLVELQS